MGMFWTDTTLDERNRTMTRYEYEFLGTTRKEVKFYQCRHDSLRYFTWLVEWWPNSLGASIGHDMLRRAFKAKRHRLSHHVLPRWNGHPWSPSPHDIAPEILSRLKKLIEV